MAKSERSTNQAKTGKKQMLPRMRPGRPGEWMAKPSRKIPATRSARRSPGCPRGAASARNSQSGRRGHRRSCVRPEPAPEARSASAAASGPAREKRPAETSDRTVPRSQATMCRRARTRRSPGGSSSRYSAVRRRKTTTAMARRTGSARCRPIACRSGRSRASRRRLAGCESRGGYRRWKRSSTNRRWQAGCR